MTEGASGSSETRLPWLRAAMLAGPDLRVLRGVRGGGRRTGHATHASSVRPTASCRTSAPCARGLPRTLQTPPRAPPTGWCVPPLAAARCEGPSAEPGRASRPTGPGMCFCQLRAPGDDGGQAPGPREHRLQRGLGTSSEGLGTRHVTCGAVCPPASFQLFKTMRAPGSAEIWPVRASADGTGSARQAEGAYCARSPAGCTDSFTPPRHLFTGGAQA